MIHKHRVKCHLDPETKVTSQTSQATEAKHTLPYYCFYITLPYYCQWTGYVMILHELSHDYLLQFSV